MAPDLPYGNVKCFPHGLVPCSAGNCTGREQKDGCPKELKMRKKQQRNIASWEECTEQRSQPAV